MTLGSKSGGSQSGICFFCAANRGRSGMDTSQCFTKGGKDPFFITEHPAAKQNLVQRETVAEIAKNGS